MTQANSLEEALRRALAAYEKTEAELKASEARNRAHSLFVANLLHDLRTPLNAVIGYAELVENAAFGPHIHPKYGECGKDIADAGRLALGLAAKLVELERNEADPNVVRSAAVPVDVAAEIRVVMRLVAEQARKAGVKLQESIAPDLPTIMSDPDMIRRILINLIGNAVKFSPSGGRVTVSANPDIGRGILVMVISDTGRGIASEDLARIMKPFSGSPSATGGMGGFGLGLPLVKQLTDALGGKIELKSRPGLGTAVTVQLPFVRQPSD
jgi:signal transduction histidine kinase